MAFCTGRHIQGLTFLVQVPKLFCGVWVTQFLSVVKKEPLLKQITEPIERITSFLVVSLQWNSSRSCKELKILTAYLFFFFFFFFSLCLQWSELFPLNEVSNFLLICFQPLKRMFLTLSWSRQHGPQYDLRDPAPGRVGPQGWNNVKRLSKTCLKVKPHWTPSLALATSCKRQQLCHILSCSREKENKKNQSLFL